MTNQDGKQPKTADPSSRAPTPKPGSVAITPGDANPPLTVVAVQTAVGNVNNTDP